MYWNADEWEEAYRDLLYEGDDELEEEDENEGGYYFDVPLPYRPIQP